MSHDELIQYCKDNKIDHLTKQKKPKAQATLLKELSKLSINDKPDIEINNLELIIKQCHNYLYKSSGIVGSKAQNDIMRVLIIRIFNILLSNKNVYIEKIVNDYKETNSILKDFKETYNNNIDNIKDEEEKEIIQKHLNYIEYLYDINKILEYKGNSIEDEWKEFIIYCVSDILKNIYSKDDYRFNTPNSYDINELIKIISKISINDDFIHNFAEHNGDIHEYFLKYQGNVNSKQLGQFFTPRSIIEKTLNDCGLKDIILSLDKLNLDICDPCMGTGGLLCYTYRYCKDKILPSNIYGCDIEKDTIKFGIASLMLTTNEYNDNIIRCNSLIENPYLFENKKFNIIFTNPPFGTKNNYKELKENFESYKKLNYKDSSLKFEDIYPINTNKGTNLFIQLVIYLLKENGVCAIVLPDGELMTSNNNSNIDIRTFILDKCKILKIINIEGGVFINTGIKTKVLIFQKGNFDNYNQEVEFIEINSNGIKILGKEKLNEIYQFNISKKEEIKNYDIDIQIKTLGEICEDISISKNISSSDRVDGIFRFFTCSREETSHNEYQYEGTFIIHGSRGSTIKESIFMTNNEKFAIGTSMFISKVKNNNECLTKYIYYYLKLNQLIFNKYITGTAIPMINKINYYDIKIPIPSIEYQKEIVEYLDLIYEKNIKTSNQKIEEIKKLNENYLKITLNNKKIEIKTLGEICTNIKTGKNKTSDDKKGTLYPYYGTGGITGYTNDFLVDDNYILIARNGTIGQILLLSGKSFPSDHMFIIKDTTENIKYLYFAIKYLGNLSNYAHGATIQGITKENLNNIKIPIPSLEKQKEIVEYLDFNNNLIDNLNKEIENNKKQGELFFDSFLCD